MTHPVLAQRYPLNLLPRNVANTIRELQSSIMEDDSNGTLLNAYPFYFMGELLSEQRAQVTAFMEATPLRTRSRTCSLLVADRVWWQFWTPRSTRARQGLQWVEKHGAFVVMPLIPQTW